MSITEKITKLRELLGKATPGPWSHGGQSRKNIGYYGPKGPDFDLHRLRDVAETTDFHDGDLIAEMRNSLPQLLDELEARVRDCLPNPAYHSQPPISVVHPGLCQLRELAESWVNFDPPSTLEDGIIGRAEFNCAKELTEILDNFLLPNHERSADARDGRSAESRC